MSRGGAERVTSRLPAAHRAQPGVRAPNPDHDLSCNQELDSQLTEPPGCSHFTFLFKFFKIFLKKILLKVESEQRQREGENPKQTPH